MTTLSLHPLLRHSVGYDRFNQLFDSLSKIDEASPAYPPYNIEKLDSDRYAITMAVAGFSDRDISLVQEGDTLSVHGKIEKSDEDKEREFLHKGIATRSFERRFSLAEHVKVVNATLEHGLLTVSLQREVPEAAKPRIIAINQVDTGNKKLKSA